MREVDDVEVVEDRDRGAAADLVDDFLHERLQDHFGVDGAEIAGGEREHLGPEEEPAPVAPTYRGLRACAGKRRTVAALRPVSAATSLRVIWRVPARNDCSTAQAALEGGDEFLCAVFRHAKSGLSDFTDD
jgi:hypothetical protein